MYPIACYLSRDYTYEHSRTWYPKEKRVAMVNGSIIFITIVISVPFNDNLGTNELGK